MNGLFKFCFLIYVAFSSVVISQEATHCYAPEIQCDLLTSSIQKAIRTRRSSEIDRLSKERGSSEENQLAHEMTSIVPDYSYQNKHEESIWDFIAFNTGVAPTLFCVAPNRMKTREFVFFDRNNRLAIKVFPQIPEHYFKIVHELSGHEAFKNLGLEKSKIVEFSMLGKYRVDGIDYLMLGMSLAEGVEARKIIEQIYLNQEQDKLDSINQAKIMLRRLGEAIAEVHVKNAIKTEPSDTHKEAVQNFYSSEYHKLMESQELSDKQKEILAQKFQELVSQYGIGPVYFAAYHGDAHLGNFLYEPFSECISIIDSVKAHLTVDQNGQPLSEHFVNDVVKIEKAIAKEILYYEGNNELIAELIAAFREGYDENAVEIWNASHYDLDRFYTFLRKLISASEKLKTEQDPKEKEILQRIHDYYHRCLF